MVMNDLIFVDLKLEKCSFQNDGEVIFEVGDDGDNLKMLSPFIGDDRIGEWNGVCCCGICNGKRSREKFFL